MIDLLDLAAELEAIGAKVTIHDIIAPTLYAHTPALTVMVFADGSCVIATDAGGKQIALPGIETDLFAVLTRHVERARLARKTAA